MMTVMTGFAVDSDVLEQLITSLERCDAEIIAVGPRADTSAAEAAVPESVLPQALRRFATELRSTINECRLAAAATRSGVNRSRLGYDDAEQRATEGAAALAADLHGGNRPIGAPVRPW